MLVKGATDVCLVRRLFGGDLSRLRRLTQWGRVMHICVSKLNFIGSDNGLWPSRHQAVMWTNAVILLIRTLGTNCSEISSGIHAFTFMKINLNMPSAKRRQFCLGFNVLNKTISAINIPRQHCGGWLSGILVPIHRNHNADQHVITPPRVSNCQSFYILLR